MSFSFGYEFNVKSSARTPAHASESARLDALFIVDAIRLLPLGGDEQLAINQFTLRRGIVRNNLLPALRRCTCFRTLDEHHAAIAADPVYRGIDARELDAVLRRLRTLGLLIGAPEWLERFPSPAASVGDDAGDDWILVVSTCDRPPLLSRLLDSATPYLTAGTRPRRAILIDDSRQPAHRAANRQHWRGWLDANALAGDYWDRAARTRLADDLSRRVPDQAAVIAWLLSPEAFAEDLAAYGQIKNLTLLLTAGRRALLLDDDCLLRPRASPLVPDPPPLRIGQRPLEVALYPARSALPGAALELPLNPFAAHLEVLGQTPPAVFAALGQSWRDPAWLRDLDGPTFGRLMPETQVRLTVNGVSGDPGTGSMDWLYARREASNNRVARFLDGMPADETRERLVWKGRSMHLLTFDTLLMTTTLTGIDNRALLPCGLPFGRGGDVVFGGGIKALHPETLSCDFSWSLPHLPDPPRYWQRPRWNSGMPPDPPDPVWCCEKTLYRAAADCRTRDPVARLRYLADCHHGWAWEPEARIGALIEQIQLEYQSALLRVYRDNRAANPDLSLNWQTDLATLAERTAARLEQPLALAPDRLADYRRLLASHAAALRLWPSLYGQAMERDGELQ